MARRNMRMEEYLELVYQWHRGRSIRQIRDSLQISRKTIRKYLLLFMARRVIPNYYDKETMLRLRIPGHTSSGKRPGFRWKYGLEPLSKV